MKNSITLPIVQKFMEDVAMNNRVTTAGIILKKLDTKLDDEARTYLARINTAAAMCYQQHNLTKDTLRYCSIHQPNMVTTNDN